MSREERRAYKRMTRNQDPYAPPPLSPAARARAEAQQRARQRTRARPAAADGRLLSGRLTLWLVGGALAAFLLGLSVAWRPREPMLSVAVGLAAAAGWVVLLLAFAFWRRQQRRAAPAGSRPRGPAER